MLLKQIGLDFEIRPSKVDESIYRNLPPADRVEALALAKAHAVAGGCSEALVIGADTVVVYRDKVLGKPSSPEEAAEMLALLSGRRHTVYTGLALVRVPGGIGKSTHARTDVTFNRLNPDEINAYIATGEPLDKAGGYGIQGYGALLVKNINGDYFNVVGLPLVKLSELMFWFGYNIWKEIKVI